MNKAGPYLSRLQGTGSYPVVATELGWAAVAGFLLHVAWGSFTCRGERVTSDDDRVWASKFGARLVAVTGAAGAGFVSSKVDDD